MTVQPWKEGEPSTPENLPARLMWFHERLKVGESTAICHVAPFVEAAEEIVRLREIEESYDSMMSAAEDHRFD